MLLASSAAFAAILAQLAAAALASAQLPLEPRGSGQSVTPAYEGWYRNADGSISLLVGYFNRNLKQEARHPGRAPQITSIPAVPIVGSPRIS